jgi:hypothetical protein
MRFIVSNDETNPEMQFFLILRTGFILAGSGLSHFFIRLSPHLLVVKRIPIRPALMEELFSLMELAKERGRLNNFFIAGESASCNYVCIWLYEW